MNLHKLLSAALLCAAFACGGVPSSEGANDQGERENALSGSCGEGTSAPDAGTANACTAAKGQCVGLSPGACASGNWGDPADCGGAVGVGCCLPGNSVPDAGSANACVAAKGKCVAIYPGTCASGNWGDPGDCGGGVGVGCCLP